VRSLRKVPAGTTALHRSAFQTLLERMVPLCSSVAMEAGLGSFAGAFERLVGTGGATKFPDLCADKVKMPTHCGSVDPLPFLPEAERVILSDVDLLFGGRGNDLPMNGTLAAGSRREYLTLVVKQLRAGKTGLTSTPRSTAASFVVDKGDGAEQREVWNGAKLSAMALRPPKPPYLACPAALTGLEADDARRVYASVRDGKSFFDQLKLPRELSLTMCRPGVLAEDLLAWSEPGQPQLTRDELQGYVIDGGGSAGADPQGTFYPASLVFPMGFSWSSYVAQSTMLHSLGSAGLGPELMLSEEHRRHLLQQDVGQRARCCTH
jgi:hypothetical protein